MSKIKVFEVDGEQVAHATLELDLGKVTDESQADENVFYAGMDIKSMEGLYKQMLYERGGKVKMEEFEDVLDQYVNLKLLELVGVSSSPIKRNREGVIVGLKESVELEDTVK